MTYACSKRIYFSILTKVLVEYYKNTILVTSMIVFEKEGKCFYLYFFIHKKLKSIGMKGDEKYPADFYFILFFIFTQT